MFQNIYILTIKSVILKYIFNRISLPPAHLAQGSDQPTRCLCAADVVGLKTISIKSQRKENTRWEKQKSVKHDLSRLLIHKGNVFYSIVFLVRSYRLCLKSPLIKCIDCILKMLFSNTKVGFIWQVIEHGIIGKVSYILCSKMLTF